MYQFVKKEFTYGSDVSYILHPSYNTLEEAEEFIQSLNPDLEVLDYTRCNGIQKLQKTDKTCYFIKGYRVFSFTTEVNKVGVMFNDSKANGMYYLFKLAD